MHFAETHYIKSYILVYCGTLWYNVVGAFADTGHHSTHPVFAFFSSARARADTVVGFRHLCDVVYYGTLWYIVIYCGTLWHNVVGAFADTGHHSSPAAPQHLLIASLTTTTPTMSNGHLAYDILDVTDSKNVTMIKNIVQTLCNLHIRIFVCIRHNA